VPHLRGNLHAHTTFSDGVLAPHRLVEEYERLGYDFLAITDHDDRVPDGYWRALERLAPRLVLFHGIELSWMDFPQHVGKVVGERETLYVLNHPARYKLTVDDTLRRIEVIRSAGVPLDAIEVTDTGLYRPLYHSESIPLAKIATDDAHKPVHFGRAWVEVDAARDRDAIIHAIRAGDFALGFRQPELPS
jgi:predicted metal-dependent phosphoesterase TrpH